MSNRTRKLPRGTWCRRLAWAVSLVFAGGILIQAGLAQPPPPPAPAPDREPVTESPRDVLPWLVDQNRRAREAKQQEDGHGPSRRDRPYPPPVVRKVPDIAGVYRAGSNTELRIQQTGDSVKVLLDCPEGMTVLAGRYQNQEFQQNDGSKFYRQCFFGKWSFLKLPEGKTASGVGALYPHPSLAETIVLDRWEEGEAGYVPLRSLQFTGTRPGGTPGLVKTPPGPGPPGPGPDLVQTPPEPPGGSGGGPVSPPSEDKTNLPGVDRLGDGAGFH